MRRHRGRRCNQPIFKRHQSFNGAIPFIALQMSVLKVGEHTILVFSKVLDELILGLDDEDEERETTDRAYWENRSTKENLALVDDMLELVHTIDTGYSLKFTKFYIGLAKDGKANNFVIFVAKKNSFRFEPLLNQSDEIQKILDDSGLTVMDYDKLSRRYRIRLTRDDIANKREVLVEIIRKAYDQYVK